MTKIRKRKPSPKTSYWARPSEQGWSFFVIWKGWSLPFRSFESFPSRRLALQAAREHIRTMPGREDLGLSDLQVIREEDEPNTVDLGPITLSVESESLSPPTQKGETNED